MIPFKRKDGKYLLNDGSELTVEVLSRFRHEIKGDEGHIDCQGLEVGSKVLVYSTAQNMVGRVGGDIAEIKGFTVHSNWPNTICAWTTRDVFAWPITLIEKAPYPEHEKLSKVKEAHETLSSFCEFLESTGKQIVVSAESELSGIPCFSAVRFEALIAEYFDIDLKAFHAEKEQMYQAMTKEAQ